MYKLRQKKYKLKGLLFFILSLYYQCAMAQKPPVVFKNYSVLDGISYNYVSEIFQDSEGLIWLGTPDGLNKFRAYDFKVYRAVDGDSTSLPSNYISALTEDRHRNMWIGTWGGGLCVYDRKTDSFKYPKISVQDSLININFVSELYNDRVGNIWVCSSQGLVKVDPSTYQAKLYRHKAGDPASISHNQVVSIVQDKHDKYWVATYGGGLNYYDPVTDSFTHYLHHDEDDSSLGENYLSGLYYDSKDRLWIATPSQGVDLMADEPGKFTHFVHNVNDAGALSNNQVTDIAETPNGKIWIGTDNGLCLFNEKERNFYVYKKGLFDPKGLSASEIKSLFADRDGRLWVGTYNGGVNLFDHTYINTLHYYALPLENSLSHNDVTSFLWLGKNKILIGTDGGGLNIFNPQTANFISYKHNSNDPESIGGNKIKDLLQDSKGRIWITFWNGGLDLFDIKSQSFIHYTTSRGAGYGPNNNNIMSIAEDEEGMLWLTTLGGGLNKFDPTNKTFEYFNEQIVTQDGLEDSRVVSLYIDAQHTIWIGSSLGNLYSFDKDKGIFVNRDIQDEGESKSQVQCMFEDSNGNFWLGLEGGGLKLYDRNNESFKTFTTKDGLPSNHLHAIEESSNGKLWLSTNLGISSFHPEKYSFENYDMSIGLQGLQFNREASAMLPSGEILFGGANGFNMFHPDNLTVYDRSNPIVFTNLQIFNKPVSIRQKDSPLQAHINETASITLSYDQSVFSIEYAALNYTDPEKTMYKYRLKGFVNEGWQEVGNERKATYTNLNPGTYEFIVTTMGTPTADSQLRALTIIITPPWWQTWWARLFTILLFGGMLFTAYYFRVQSIKKQNTRLEHEVSERTLKLQMANKALHEQNLLIQEQKEEIQTQAEELVESNEEIRSINHRLEERVEIRTADLKKSNQELDNFVYRVSHDIRAPLSSILGLINLIEDEKDPQQLNAYLKMTTDSIHKLDGFVKDILDYSRNSRMEIVREEVDFSELIQEVMGELQYMENAYRLNIIEENRLDEMFYNDIGRLKIIFRNLFSNAIKYLNVREKHNFLRIRIDAVDQVVRIVLEDNGIGISDAALTKVFNMFFRGSDLSNGSGIGLYIVKETVEKLDGNIEIQSQLGIGTTIKMELPNIQKSNMLQKFA